MSLRPMFRHMFVIQLWRVIESML